MPLIKIAASFDARRKKQYWQLLKRLYGGNDEAITAMKNTRDSGIYHGTKGKHVPKILEEGIKSNKALEFGEGSFVADRRTANYYNQPEVRDKMFGIKRDQIIASHPDGSMEEIEEPSKLVEYAKAHPEHYTVSDPGGLFRLKYPSELRGTKTLYPDPQSAKVFDIQKADSLPGVAPVQIDRLRHSSLFSRYEDRLKKILPHLSEDRLKPLVTSSYLRDMGDVKTVSPGWMVSKAEDEWKEYQKQPDVSWLSSRMAKFKAEDKTHVQTPDAQRQLQYYGKLNGKRLFERTNPGGHRYEMFFDKTSLPPELIQQV